MFGTLFGGSPFLVEKRSRVSVAFIFVIFEIGVTGERSGKGDRGFGK